MPRLKQIEQALYVIEAPTGECKIGIAEWPKVRLQSLQCGVPRGEMVLRFESERSAGIWAIEDVVHEKLAHKRLNGEWFDVSADEAVLVITAALEAGPPPVPEPQPKRARGRPPGTQVRHQARNDAILAALRSGKAGTAIAAELSISKQRVHQIAKRAGLTKGSSVLAGATSCRRQAPQI